MRMCVTLAFAFALAGCHAANTTARNESHEPKSDVLAFNPVVTTMVNVGTAPLEDHGDEVIFIGNHRLVSVKRNESKFIDCGPGARSVEYVWNDPSPHGFLDKPTTLITCDKSGTPFHGIWVRRGPAGSVPDHIDFLNDEPRASRE